MNMKKLLALLLPLALALSLAGCGKQPTAQDLLDGVPGIDTALYQNAYIDLSASSKAAADDGGDSDDSMFSGIGTVGLKAGIEGAGGTWHVYDCELSVGASGFDMSFGLEGWADTASGVTYSRMTAFGQDSGWTSSGLGGVGGTSIDASGLTASVASLSKLWSFDGADPVLVERGKEDDYSVAWTVPGSMLAELAASMDAGADLDMGDLSVEAVFGRNDKILKSMSIYADGADARIDAYIEFRTMNGGDAISIPEDVIQSAVPEDAGFSLSGDTDGLDGWASDWPSDDDAYWNDGDGYDATIDAMAEQMSSRMPDGGTVRVWHMSDYTELDFSYESPDGSWSGNLDVRRYTSDEFGGADAYFQGQKDFCEEWYSEFEPYFANETEIVYIKYGSELDMCRLLGDGMTISADIYTHDDDPGDEAVLALLGQLLSMAGFQ